MLEAIFGTFMFAFVVLGDLTIQVVEWIDQTGGIYGRAGIGFFLAALGVYLTWGVTPKKIEFRSKQGEGLRRWIQDQQKGGLR